MKNNINELIYKELDKAKNYNKVEAINREIRENIKGHIDNDGFIYL